MENPESNLINTESSLIQKLVYTNSQLEKAIFVIVLKIEMAYAKASNNPSETRSTKRKCFLFG